MSTQHTPGPWHVDLDAHFQVRASNEHATGPICRMASFGKDQMKADAQLIAAAPDLLEALRNCLNWTHRSIDLEVSGSMQHAAKIHAAEAEAIIAKATGKESA